MVTVNRMRDCYAHVNISGKVGACLGGPLQWLDSAETYQQSAWYEDKFKSLGLGFLARCCTAQALALTTTRMLTMPIGIGALISPVMAPWQHVVLGGQAIIGHGLAPVAHRYDFPRTSRYDSLVDVLSLQNRFAQYGFIGLLVEFAPLRLAASAEQANYLKMAKGCLVAAIVGRVALQGPRMVCLGTTQVITLAISAHYLVLSFFLEGYGIRVYAISSVHSPFRNDQASVRRLRRDFTNHQGMSCLVNRALQSFRDIDDSVEGGRLVRAQADEMVKGLRTICAKHPDQTMFRGGVAILRDFMALTYEEAGWVAP